MNPETLADSVPWIAAAVAAAGWIVLARLAAPRQAPSTPGGKGAGGWMRTVLGVVAAVGVWSLTDRPGLALAAIVLWMGTNAVLAARKRQRLALEEERHAIEAIGAASRALRAGIPIGGMLDFLSTESHGEARRAFREILEREGVGEELGSAIRRVLLTSHLQPLRAFGVTILAQIGAGGDIADTTDRLARSLVERSRMRRRARTIMAYTRTAALVLAALPAIVVPLLCFLIEDYARLMLHRPWGNAMLAIAAALVVGGVVLMQRLSRIDRPHARAAK